MLRGYEGARSYSLCQQIQKELAVLGAYYVVNYFILLFLLSHVYMCLYKSLTLHVKMKTDTAGREEG